VFHKTSVLRISALLVVNCGKSNDIDSTRKMAIIGLYGKFGKIGNTLPAFFLVVGRNSLSSVVAEREPSAAC
jgi:hypothetical protein